MYRSTNDESEFDEERRFATHSMHEQSRVDESLTRLATAPGVLNVSIVEMATGDVIASSLDAAGATRYAEHMPALLHRAQACCRVEDDNRLSLLIIGTRETELLLCTDEVSGAAVVVEQTRHVPSTTRDDSSPSTETIYRKAQADYRRLLIGCVSPSAAEFVFSDDLVADDGQADSYK